MKKILAIISLALVIATLACLLSSCGAAKLKGKWKNDHYGTLEFKSGGKGNWDGDEFTYKVKGKKLSITYTEGNYSETETYEFKVKGKTLTLTYDGDSEDFTKVK